MYCFRISLEGPLSTTLRLPTKTSKHKSMGGKMDLKYFLLIDFPWRKLCFQRSRSRSWGWGLSTAESFPEEAAESVVPFCLTVLVQTTSVASGCASTLGGMVKGLIVCYITHPKVYATGGKLGSCIFPFSLGCALISCESAFSWAVPSQTLQALALLDQEQLFGLGAVTVPFPAGMWSYCSLSPGPLLSLAFLPSGLADLCLSHWVAFYFA